MAKLFAPGNPGRPKGAKNRIATQVYEDVIAHWNEIVPGPTGRTKGKAALEMTFKLDPGRYLSFVGSLLPKEFLFETSMSEMDDDGIDNLIEHLRARLIEQRSATAAEVKEPVLINGPEKSET